MIHGISHGLGLAGARSGAVLVRATACYKPGDVFTIEPGIYVSTRMLDALPDTPKNRAFIAKVKPVVARYENTGVTHRGRLRDHGDGARSGSARRRARSPRSKR